MVTATAATLAPIQPDARWLPARFVVVSAGGRGDRTIDEPSIELLGLADIGNVLARQEASGVLAQDEAIALLLASTNRRVLQGVRVAVCGHPSPPLTEHLERLGISALYLPPPLAADAFHAAVAWLAGRPRAPRPPLPLGRGWR